MWYKGISSSSSGGVMWVDRGETTAPDFVIGDLTFDGVFRDMDISSIVGTGQKLVLIRGYVRATVAGKSIKFRTNGTTYADNVAESLTQEANTYQALGWWVMTDENGIVEFSGAPTNFNVVNITVRGWFA